MSSGLIMSSDHKNNYREQFSVLRDHPFRIYCNNAGGSQILDSVSDYMTNYMENNHVQLDCAHEVGDESNDFCKEAREFVNILFNNVAGTIQFGSSTSQMAMNIANALPIHKFNEVVMCEALHYSMITPIEYRLNQTKSMIVKWWKPKFKYSFDYEDLYGLNHSGRWCILFTS